MRVASEPRGLKDEHLSEEERDSGGWEGSHVKTEGGEGRWALVVTEGLSPLGDSTISQAASLLSRVIGSYVREPRGSRCKSLDKLDVKRLRVCPHVLFSLGR